MKPEPLNYRPAPSPARSTSIVHAERSATGQVVVRVTLPPDALRQRLFGMIASALLPAAFAAVGIGLIWSHPVTGTSRVGMALTLLFPLLPVLAVLVFLIVSLSRFRRSYTFQADREGITIQSYRGRREWCERIPRERITDVRLGFGGPRQGGAWLIIAITPGYRANRRLLGNVGAEHLARIADALRVGIGLPRVSWPSGLPIGPGSQVRPHTQSPTADRSHRYIGFIVGGVCILLGPIFATMAASNARIAYHRLHELRKTTCELLDKRIYPDVGEHYRGGAHSSHSYEAWTRVSYQDAAGSHVLSGDFFPTSLTEDGKRPDNVLAGMTVGARYPLWVDDRDPHGVYLDRGEDTPWTYSLPIGVGCVATLAGLGTILAGAIEVIFRGQRSATKELPKATHIAIRNN